MVDESFRMFSLLNLKFTHNRETCMVAPLNKANLYSETVNFVLTK